MNKNKSPGLDGITVEFYQTLWHIMSSDSLEIFNDCFKSGNLCDAMIAALIRLIYKHSGNKFDVNNLFA